MHGKPAICVDSALLERWCEARSESAFAELVRKYERLVVGAGVRRTGDLELARDVAQQVFAMLAAKARLLVGHPNIAGWLYRAASQIAAQSRLSDLRRRARHSAAAEQADPRHEQHWPLFEEALNRLSGPEREALVLHFFEDLSYSEMAAALRISEVAARKRVSRGVRTLGALLRRHGIGSPRALLVGATVLQATFPAQAGLAAAALGAPVSVSAPAAFALTLNAFMSHLSTKIAICAAGLALVPLAYHWNDNANLRTRMAQLRESSALPPPLPGIAPLVASSNVLAGEQAKLAAAQNSRKVAEARLAKLIELEEKAKDEIVFSLGTVDKMGRELAAGVKRLTNLVADSGRFTQDSPEWKQHEAKVQEMADVMPQLMSTWREVPRIERDAAKAARFYAALLGETLGLEEDARARLEAPLEEWMKQLHGDGLAFPQRPKENAEEWDERRMLAMENISNQLKAVVSADKAEDLSLVGALLPLEPGQADSTHFHFDAIFGPRP